MVGRKAAARVGLVLLAAVVAATRRAERSSIVAIKKESRLRREGKEGMLVRRLVGRAAGKGRGCVFSVVGGDALFCVPACALLRPSTTTSVLLTFAVL